MSSLNKRPAPAKQDSAKAPRLDPPQKTPTCILDLNDDCIRHILQYLKAREGVHFGLIDGRIYDLVGEFHFKDSILKIVKTSHLGPARHKEYGRVVRSLHIEDRYKEDLQMLFPCYTKLRMLRLFKVSLDVKTMQHFPGNLQDLSLQSCQLATPDVRVELQRRVQQTLTSLTLTNPRLSMRLPKLERLRIGNVNTKEDKLGIIKRNGSTIKYLTVDCADNGDSYYYDDSFRIDDFEFEIRFARAIEACKQLVELTLLKCDFALRNLNVDNWYESIFEAPSKTLQMLRITANLPYTTDLRAFGARFVNLKSLWIEATYASWPLRITDCEWITGLRKLEKIALLKASTGDFAVVEFLLQSLPLLKWLALETKGAVSTDQIARLDAYLKEAQRPFVLASRSAPGAEIPYVEYCFGPAKNGQWGVEVKKCASLAASFSKK